MADARTAHRTGASAFHQPRTNGHSAIGIQTAPRPAVHRASLQGIGPLIDLIQKRLDLYKAGDALREEQALREIVQEIALYGLWRSGIFEVAAFHSGTSLRILHGFARFSEDLDFLLKAPD